MISGESHKPACWSFSKPSVMNYSSPRRFLSRDSAQFGLDVIEEKREPRQIKLVMINGSRELGRWRIGPDGEIGAVLDSLTQRLSHEAKDCSRSNGITGKGLEVHKCD